MQSAVKWLVLVRKMAKIIHRMVVLLGLFKGLA